MKKFLLMTTAVAGLALTPAAAQAEVELDLGGYFKGYAGYTDQDTTGVTDFAIKREAELHFTGETTLDNGLTIGARFEIQTEADAAGNDTEESYMYLSGNWGRVNFGAEDGAAYLLQIAAPSADSNIDGIDPDIEFVNFATTVNTPLRYELAPTQDADKVTYLTPKFSGFQAGVSWAGDSIQDGLGSNLTGQNGDSSTGTVGAIGGDVVTNATLYDVIEVAARYDGEVNGVGFHLGGGFVNAEVTDGSADDGNYEAWNVGAKFDIGAVGVGASYSQRENFTGTGDDSDVLVVGADYKTGPYKFGASYFNSETDIGAANDEVDRYSVGAGYTYGPGMSFRGSVHVYDIDDSTAAGDNDATAFVVGTDIQF